MNNVRLRYLVLAHAALVAQTTEPKEIRFQFDPAPRVRPGESISIQAQLWGEVTDKDGNKRTGRLRDTAAMQAAPGQGVVSKPYRFQGKDDGNFVSTASGASAIFQSLAGKFTEKDAVLYTAPMQPGRYKVQAEKGMLRAEAEIEVTADAPSLRPVEKQDFRKEDDTNPYRRLAEHWAPFLAQETWWQPKADVPTRFDFDGDWTGDNNWDNGDTGTSQAYVYYAAVETSTHWFLHYNFFHPRDYSDNCVVGTCHENDNEGIILTVRKDGSEFGKLELMETLAHNNVYSFANEPRLKKGAHNIDGKIEFHDGHHPIVFIEAGGHGALGSSGDHSLYSASRNDFKSGTGMTFLYRGVAERPKHGDDRLIGYDLLPIEQAWWARATQGGSKTFDAEYVYAPFGGRPGAGQKYMGSFLGRKHGANKAKPFWGWHDERTRRSKVLNTGQWALDPAYAVTKNVTYPPDLPVDLNYTYNPFLGVGQVAVAPAPAPAPVPGPVSTPPIQVATPTEGTCQLEAVIDGAVLIQVRNATASYEIQNGQAEKEASIGCNGELPNQPVRVFEARKTRGRGLVTVVERPSEANQFTAKLRIDDPSRGADRYVVVIRWGL